METKGLKLHLIVRPDSRSSFYPVHGRTNVCYPRTQRCAKFPPIIRLNICRLTRFVQLSRIRGGSFRSGWMSANRRKIALRELGVTFLEPVPAWYPGNFHSFTLPGNTPPDSRLNGYYPSLVIQFSRISPGNPVHSIRPNDSNFPSLTYESRSRLASALTQFPYAPGWISGPNLANFYGFSAGHSSYRDFVSLPIRMSRPSRICRVISLGVDETCNKLYQWNIQTKFA